MKKSALFLVAVALAASSSSLLAIDPFPTVNTPDAGTTLALLATAVGAMGGLRLIVKRK